MATTISNVKPSYAKAGDAAITINGTGFVGEATESLAWHRKSGDVTWIAVGPARITYVSATELTIAIDAGNTDDWDAGLNDVGVGDFEDTAPDAYLAQALFFYIVTADDPDNFIKGAPDALYIDGRYLGQTHGGAKLAHGVETSDIVSDQSLIPLRTIKVGETFEFSVPLGEVTLENLKDVWGLSATIADLGTGRRRLTFGGDTAVREVPVMAVVPAGAGKKWALIFYRCAVVAPGDMSFSKDDQVDLPLSIKILADTSRAANDQVGRVEEYTVA